LVVNALNTIPLGELDGGRIAFAMWGRRAASRIGVVSTLLLGLTGIVDELALYWVLLVLFLQRGPLVPQQEELSEPSKELTPLAVGLLFLPLLILLPLPFGLSSSPVVESVF
jgi:membrane-associated protease RseP (regulator of RpoE activity)